MFELIGSQDSRCQFFVNELISLLEKRNATTPIGPSGPPQKMRISEEASESYKSKLNEYTQRLKLEAVKYEINECAEGFVATAIVQGRCFSSARPADRRKQAEQSAAYAVLVGLGELPIAGTRSKPLCTASAVSHPAAALANRNGHSSIRMKPEFISPGKTSLVKLHSKKTVFLCRPAANFREFFYGGLNINLFLNSLSHRAVGEREGTGFEVLVIRL